MILVGRVVSCIRKIHLGIIITKKDKSLKRKYQKINHHKGKGVFKIRKDINNYKKYMLPKND